MYHGTNASVLEQAWICIDDIWLILQGQNSYLNHCKIHANFALNKLSKCRFACQYLYWFQNFVSLCTLAVKYSGRFPLNGFLHSASKVQKISKFCIAKVLLVASHWKSLSVHWESLFCKCQIHLVCSFEMKQAHRKDRAIGRLKSKMCFTSMQFLDTWAQKGLSLE